MCQREFINDQTIIWIEVESECIYAKDHYKVSIKEKALRKFALISDSAFFSSAIVLKRFSINAFSPFAATTNKPEFSYFFVFAC